MRRNVIVVLGLAVLMVAASSAAYALPMIRLTDLATGATCTLNDNAAASVCAMGGVGSGDNAGAAGGVSGVFTLGVWSINVSTGITKPAAGSPTAPYMDLNTVNTSTGAGSITIEFSETGFENTGNSTMTWGGTTAGTVVYSAYSNAGAVNFGKANLLGTSGVQGPGAYGGSIVGAPAGAAPNSLTQVVVYTHTGAGNSSGNHEVRVPEPTALLLLGSGLLGLAIARRRRQ